MTTRQQRWRAVLVTGLVVATALVAPRGPVAHADAAGRGGDYVPLASPGRLLDTRSGAKLAADESRSFPVLGNGGLPTSGVTAVLVDVAAVAATANTWLALRPSGTAEADYSNVNTRASTPPVSNTTIVPLGTNNEITVYNISGSTHAVVDVHGYFTNTTGGGRGGFVPLRHAPILTAVTVGAGDDKVVELGGAVPAGAGAAFVDLKVTGATVAGYLTARPDGGTAANSALDYATGDTSSGVAVKLGTDRRVIVRNNGSASIKLSVTIQGYFSASQTQGAGLRRGAGRLVAGVSLSAGQVVEISIAGRHALPTRGIAGALVNFTATSGSVGGSLRAWPSDESEPAASVVAYPATASRAGTAIVRPAGPEGRIKVKNNSTGTVRLYADLLAWFADPLPQVPVRPYTRVAAMALPPAAGATAGFIEYAYVDNIGTLRHGHQEDPNNVNTVRWTAVSGGDAYTGTPTLTYLQNGAVQIGAQNIDSNVHALTQTQLYPAAAWGPWANLGGSMAEPPAVARLADGNSVLFAVDADGRLWRRVQNGDWRSLGDINLAGTPTVVNIRDGLQLFAMDSAGTLHTAAYRGDALSAWTSLGGTGLNGAPAAVVYPGYLVRVFVRAADGTIVTKRQTVENGPFSASWTAVGAFTATAGSPAAVISPVTGRSWVVARGIDNNLWAAEETSQGSGVWDDFAPRLAPPTPMMATDPTALVYHPGTSGDAWMIVYRDVNNLTLYVAVQESGAQLGAAAKPAFTAHALPPPPA